MKNIVILGSTGSIGESTCKVVRHLEGQFKVIGVAGGSRWQKVAEQAVEFDVRYASIQNQDSFDSFREALPDSCQALQGIEGMERMVTDPKVDFVLCGVVGTASLKPVLAAIRAGKDIGLASKEILVMAGEIVMAEAKKYGVNIIPVDSEHNAIFQCLEGQQTKDVKRLLVTCSGGPFRQTPYEEFKDITVAKALKHPTWTMGRKITIDSATLMNKSLEVIEAKWLFDVDIDQVEVVVHPQSIVHSMVEYVDGSILSQMSEPDMVFPIQFAMCYPERQKGSLKPLDFSQLMTLTFESPDHERFPSLKMARQAVLEGGTMPAVFNAANEIAVEAFLNEKITFLNIWDVIRSAMDHHQTIKKATLDEIIDADTAIRLYCQELISTGKL